MSDAIERSDLDERSKEHHRKEAVTFRRIVRIGGSCALAPVHALLSIIRPTLSLLPLGPMGALNWYARGATFAAMDLMLAASAHGFDTCPMEGFSGPKVARILKLPRKCAVVLVVALGRRAPDARIEPRLRREASDAVKEI